MQEFVFNLLQTSPKIYWSMGQINRDNSPFSIVETKTLDCQFGPRYYKEMPPKGSRIEVQGSHKIGCQAHIVIKQCVLYPEYKVAHHEKKTCIHTLKKKTDTGVEARAWQRCIISLDNHCILHLSASRGSSLWASYRGRSSRVFAKDAWKSGHENFSNYWSWHHRPYPGMKPPSPVCHAWPVQRQPTQPLWQTLISFRQWSCKPHLYDQSCNPAFLYWPGEGYAEDRTVEENWSWQYPLFSALHQW